MNGIMLVMMVGVLLLGGCGLMHSRRTSENSANSAAMKDSPAQTVQYTCPMHPEVVQDHPGNCPKCGMKLIKK